MCGIFGFLTSRASDIPDLGELRSMRDLLTHRGPDDQGEFTRPVDEGGPFVYLGHRRLSIIDLAGGHQPLSNEKETVWVTFNGEIYNFLELKSHLEALGHRFRTNSDTEVIVHAYEEYGDGCFQHFNGMFAIGIWDEIRRRLLLARDRLGKKPLYYSFVKGNFLFASELKALIAYPNFSRQINPLSFMKYLFFEYIPSPHTIFKEANKLPPASYLILEKSEIRVIEYWSPFDSGRIANHLSEGEIEAKVVDLLKQSVRRRLISDVPLGVFLSGGIDSSAIAAFAQEEIPGKVKTFSIGFEDPSFDESSYATFASKYLKTDHHQQVMNPADLLHLVPHLPDILDEPMADASILPTYLLSKFTRQYVTVALGGDGGDELFAGYPTYIAHQVARRYEFFLIHSRPMLTFFGSWLPVSDENISFDFKVKKFLSGIGYPESIRNFIWLGSFAFPELERVLSSELGSQVDRVHIMEEVDGYQKGFPSEDKTTLLQYLDLKLYLQDDILVKVDRASMACSLEVRAPFLDYELVEFIMNLPSSLKLRRFTSKYLLKKVMKDFLPKEVVHRKKKGFGVPIAKWVKGPLRELFGDLLSYDRIKREGFLNPDYVPCVLRDHLANKKDNRKQLWTLLVWELWANRYHPFL
jgi:asparagine synthase (glutamine-hydrolysing)